MRAVVFHQGALGDFLLAVSVLDELCLADPGLMLDFWSKPEHAALLGGKSWLGKCAALDGPLIPSLFQDNLWRSTPLPDFLEEADRVFILGQSGTRILAERLSIRLRARVDWIKSFPTDETGIHVTDFVRRQMAALGLQLSSSSGPLIQPHDALEKPGSSLKEFGITEKPILVHPGSGGKRKVWPPHNWHSLLHWIRNEFAVPVLLSIGPADHYLEEFSRSIAETGIPIVSGLSLTNLAALLSRCRLYIGSDSGVTHLAAAVGVPVIAIFGPTDPEIWGPRGQSVHVIIKNWDEAAFDDWRNAEAEETPDPELKELVRKLM